MVTINRTKIAVRTHTCVTALDGKCYYQSIPDWRKFYYQSGPDWAKVYLLSVRLQPYHSPDGSTDHNP